MRVTLLVTLLLEARKNPMADFKVTVTIQILTKLQSFYPRTLEPSHESATFPA